MDMLERHKKLTGAGVHASHPLTFQTYNADVSDKEKLSFSDISTNDFAR